MGYINIAVDGHSGSGKSTVCDMLARKLNINHLSSGGIYRAIALYLSENNIDYNKYLLKDEKIQKEIEKELKDCNIKVKFENFVQKIILNNIDVTDNLNTEKISDISSIISQNLQVRELVKKVQLNLAKTQDIIIDGRDITSEVLKNAKYKFFLTASIDVRAERRYLQYNKTISLDKIKKYLIERDYRDEHRDICPLKIVGDAIVIDSSNLNLEETVNKMLSYIK